MNWLNEGKRGLHFTGAKPVLSLALSLMVHKAVQSQCSSFMLWVLVSSRKLQNYAFKHFFRYWLVFNYLPLQWAVNFTKWITELETWTWESVWFMNKSFRPAELNDLINWKDPIQKNGSDISPNTQKSAKANTFFFYYYYWLFLYYF